MNNSRVDKGGSGIFLAITGESCTRAIGGGESEVVRGGGGRGLVVNFVDVYTNR